MKAQVDVHYSHQNLDENTRIYKSKTEPPIEVRLADKEFLGIGEPPVLNITIKTPGTR